MKYKRIGAKLLCFFCTAFMMLPLGSRIVAGAVSEEISMEKGTVTVTAEVDSEQDLLAFESGTRPDSALLKTASSADGIVVKGKNGETIGRLANIMNALAVYDIVPVVGVYDQQTADGVAAFFDANNVIDAVLLSDDPRLLYETRQTAKKVSGALEITDVDAYRTSTDEDLYDTAIAIRDAVNGSWARAVVLPSGTDRKISDILFERCITVWIRSDGGAAGNFGALVNGCHGIVTKDYAAAKNCIEEMPENLLTRQPQIVAHGGMPVNYQPNSLRGYQDAYENGKADVMENDLHMTKDGVVVLLHGTGVYGQWMNGDYIDDIASQTTGTGKIHELTWNQLKQYQIDGYKNFPKEPILDLDTYLDYFQNKETRHFMELKRQMQTDIVEPVVNAVRARKMEDRMNIITYWDVSAKETRRQLPEASVLLLVDNGSVILNQQKTEKEGWMALLEALNPDNLAYSPNYKTFSQEQMYQLSRRGIQTYKWTYGDMDDFEAAYINNYNTLTTDYALWAKEFDVKMEYNGDKITLGTNADESVYVRGSVTDKSGGVRERVIFDLQIIEGDLTLSKTSGGRYYADKAGTAKAIVTYASENTFSYNVSEGSSGEKTIRYKLCAPQIVEIEAEGNAAANTVPPADSAGTSSAEGGSESATDSAAGGKDENTGCNAALFFAAAPVLTTFAAAIVLKKESQKRL